MGWHLGLVGIDGVDGEIGGRIWEDSVLVPFAAGEDWLISSLINVVHLVKLCLLIFEHLVHAIV